MLLITGAAGFIGSYFVDFLNKKGLDGLIISDDFVSYPQKAANWQSLKYKHKVERTQLFNFLATTDCNIEAVVHLGARTDTTAKDYAIFQELNLTFSQKLWAYCSQKNIPYLFASSAATYGNGEHGFSDTVSPELLTPLNAYAVSKNEFDKWLATQPESPANWYGFKFFNVFGPRENHKGRMASVPFHAFHQVKKTESLNLFQSHNPLYAHGDQQRDFIYVQDLAQVLYHFISNRPSVSGLYNLGTGQARSFNDLAKALFQALDLPLKLNYIPTPEDIRDSYQYYTQADVSKLRQAGYTLPFTSLEAAVKQYVEYLESLQINHG
jgi:ADP-L-glycero-D-manno-heptose 6-epimerase